MILAARECGIPEKKNAEMVLSMRFIYDVVSVEQAKDVDYPDHKRTDMVR